MNPTPTGLHHLTAIASDPQANIDFYVELLGLRLLKKTVNFDDPSAYHLYYGDETGTPGSIITFFYWPGHEARGHIGAGQSTSIVFSAPPTSLDFWVKRLQSQNIPTTRHTRFGEDTLTFTDPDGIPIEIVAVVDDPRNGWSAHPEVPAEHALRGMHTAELTVHNAELTEKLLTETMGYRFLHREGNRTRFESASGGGSGHYIDLIGAPATRPGLGGSGTIHHLAWSVTDDLSELEMRNRLQASGHAVSTVRDRTYFRSIYYREPGGILFEIATATPGFSVDEPLEKLGTSLKLPAQFEPFRDRIESRLPILKSPQSQP